MTEFRVIVAGGRNFCDYPKLRDVMDRVLSVKLADENVKVIIVSGRAQGADTLGEKYAMERGLAVEKFPALWETDGNAAGFIRNVRMANVANACVVFPGGRGSAHMAKIARERGLMLRVIT